MKNKNKNHNKPKPVFKIDEYFVKRLNERFAEIDINRIDEVISFSKKYTQGNIMNCPFKVVANKLRNPEHPNTMYIVNPKYNLIMVSVNNLIINALYLDGKDGYDFSYKF